MLEKFALWVVCFGLSFLLGHLGLAEQGKAFLVIHLVAIGIIIAFLIIIRLVAGNRLGKNFNKLFIAIVVYVAKIAVILFATWGATKIFKIDYYVVYQIMTFGQCLCDTPKKNN